LGTTQFVGCAIGGVSIGYVMRTILAVLRDARGPLMLVTYVPRSRWRLPNLFLK